MKRMFFCLMAMMGVLTLSAQSAITSFDEVLTTRRSIRNYDATKKISEAEVRELMESVQEAPSWANLQPTHYYVAISPEKLAAVQDMANRVSSATVPPMRSATVGVHTTTA